MRERAINETAALSTFNFLKELNQLCDGGKLTAVTWLSDKYGLSHNTGGACKDLKLIVVEEGVYKWVPKAEPSRVMALNILDNLLHRSKRKVDPPVIPDMGAIDRLIQKLDIIAVQNEKGSGRMLSRALPQSSTAGSSLFAEVDSKQAIKIDLLKSVLTGLYTGRLIDDLTPQTIDGLNLSAVSVVDDVYNKFYAK